MPLSKTVTGKPFEYSGTLATGITVSFKPPYKKAITPTIIRIIRNEINNRSPVKMGANRAPLVADSVGETLALNYNETPLSTFEFLTNPPLYPISRLIVSPGRDRDPAAVRRSRGFPRRPCARKDWRQVGANRQEGESARFVIGTRSAAPESRPYRPQPCAL